MNSSLYSIHSAQYSRLLLWGAALLLFASGLQTGCKPRVPEAQPLQTQSQAIIGGQPSLEHPAVGALQRDGINFCTATLIAPRLLITAGHCVDSARIYARAQNELTFRIDVVDATKPEGYTSHYSVIMPHALDTHPRWAPEDVTRGFDVGVLTLQGPVSSSIATPIPYNLQPLDASWQGKPLLFPGYGLIFSDPYAVSPNRKHTVTLPVNQLLADSIQVQAAGKGLCHGDSGGPALAQIQGVWHVVAVNSYGDARTVVGSKPLRSRCDRGAYAFRTDLWKPYLDSFTTRFAYEAGATCKVDGDCGICGACDSTKKTCANKRTLATTPIHCRGCQTDADCGQGLCLQTLLGWRCATPCDANKCCPNGTLCSKRTTTSGSREVCTPEQGICFRPPCQADAECGPGSSCTNNLCTATYTTKTPGTCAHCTKGSDCRAGLHCEPLVQGGRCVQACGSDGNCPRDFICKQAHPGGKRRCLPAHDKCLETCTTDGECDKSSICSNGRCETKSTAAEGENCDNRACQTDLTCTNTLLGKRCHKACHVPPGDRNGACLDSRTCAQGTRCTPVRGIKGKFCLTTCSAPTDCVDGGACVGGVCVCRQNSECKTGAICETSFGGDTGFCVPSKSIRSCGPGATCTFFVNGSFCIPDQASTTGRRAEGQTCEARATCHPGLVCEAIRNQASICATNCTNDSQCLAGGRCRLGACLCQIDAQCPKGRECQLFLNERGTKYGICAPADGDVPCVVDNECSPNEICQQGACIPGNRPTPETTNEPANESILDANEPTLDASEPILDATKDAGAKETPPKDNTTIPENITKEQGNQGEPQPDTLAEIMSPGGGCGCTNLSATHDQPGHGGLWWLFLLLFAWRYPRTNQPTP